MGGAIAALGVRLMIRTYGVVGANSDPVQGRLEDGGEPGCGGDQTSQGSLSASGRGIDQDTKSSPLGRETKLRTGLVAQKAKPAPK